MTKVAVTCWLACVVTTQEPVPVHAPDQPMKSEPAMGVAVRVIGVLKKPTVQELLLPHATPAGVLVTLPAPAVVTVREKPNFWMRLP